MQPIVNGLEAEYSSNLAFDRLDANAEPGRTLMRQYRLRGHPSYVIVDPEGNKLWSATGLLDAPTLAEQVEQHFE